MKKLRIYHITFIYCVAILAFQMSPLALTIMVHNVSSFFLFASLPVGIVGIVLSVKKRDWTFVILNLIGAVELFIIIPIVYLVSGA